MLKIPKSAEFDRALATLTNTASTPLVYQAVMTILEYRERELADQHVRLLHQLMVDDAIRPTVNRVYGHLKAYRELKQLMGRLTT